MIEPLTDDDAWTSILSRLPEWSPPQLPTLVVSPHPDDETLGAGGLIATLRGLGVEAGVVAVTDGEHAYADIQRLGPIREAEQTEALAHLGMDGSKIIRLRIPDREVAAYEDELFNRLLLLVKGNCHIVAPWIGDYHPDHEACGRVAERVARETGARISYYFFWTWHRGTPEDLRGLALRSLRLDDLILWAKSEALQCHRSQLKHVSGEPILPANLLGPMQWPFEVFLPA
jgi:LmbE family N-acetylglucosaminyl deacetylase